MTKIISLVALAIVLGLVNWSIYKKEDHLANGSIVYLDLAPVDPRSLMQGDYMALRFALGEEVYRALDKQEDGGRWRHNVDASDGFVVVSLDENGVARFSAIDKDQQLAANEMKLRYRVRNGAVKFATNAFFFQEGKAREYQPARYGQFRVDDKGELLLVTMHDEKFQKLGGSVAH